MNAGDLNTRVQVQEPVEVNGSEGELERTWLTIGSRWAHVEPLSGREFWQAQQVQSDVTHRVRMRYDRQITSKHRLLLSQYETGRVLNIAHVRVRDERKAEMELLCVEPK